MNSRKVIRIAWEGLNRNKLRSLLTMLGVIIGVAAVIIMVAVSAGTEATIAEQIQGLGTNLVFIQESFTRMTPGQRQTGNGLTFEDADAIKENIPGISGVVVEQNASETVKYGGQSIDDVSVLGTTIDFPEVRDMTIAEGRYFTQTELDRKSKVAVLGATLAEELFGSNTAIGQVITVGSVKLTVIGVMEEKGSTGGVDYNSNVFTPITVVFAKFNRDPFARMMGNRVRMIYVAVENEEDIEDTIYQIELLLAKRHEVTLDTLDFTVTTQDDIIETQESTTAAFRNLLGWVAGVSLLVGGIGIMNIMLVSVTERTREIGIRQSIGATPSDIRRQFLTEALLLSLVGGLIGVISGIAGAKIFGAVGDMRTVVSISSVIIAFSSAAAVGIFFGYFPANKAAQLDPIEALRHE
ncbi:MAG: FtsX-like permease family protein [Chloroflexi bacterium]|nr:FtsX-like permease family protein [Chloroflexota bacterium]